MGATSNYYVLVRHPAERRVLLAREKDGWTLPTIEHDADCWLPNETEAVLGKVRERYGISATLLRHVRREDPQVCELEVRGRLGDLSAGLHWLERAEVGEAIAIPPEVRATLDQYLLEWDAPVPERRAPWERRGWYAKAEAWAIGELERLGFQLEVPGTQIKGGWGYSNVVRYPTNQGNIYFKAVAQSQANEPALLEHLARRWPENVPRVIASDHERRWMLMLDFGGTKTHHLPDIHHALSARLCAEIQIQAASELQVWLSLGCRDFRSDGLVRGIDLLVGDLAALQLADEKAKLSDEEAERLCTIARQYQEMSRQLADFGIPDSLVNQDFRVGNVVAANGTHVIYDWADSVVAHPFFSATRFLNYVGSGPTDGADGQASVQPAKERHQKIIDAYLEPWISYASMARLHEAFALARRINAMYLAVRFHIACRQAEPGLLWERLVIGQLRDVLKNEAKLAASEAKQDAATKS